MTAMQVILMRRTLGEALIGSAQLRLDRKMVTRDIDATGLTRRLWKADRIAKSPCALLIKDALLDAYIDRSSRSPVPREMRTELFRNAVQRLDTWVDHQGASKIF